MSARGLPPKNLAALIGLISIGLALPFGAIHANDRSAQHLQRGDQAELRIEIERHNEALYVRWVFAEDREIFAFSGFEAERRSRLEDWLVQGQGWEFDGSSIRREDGSAFSGFSARIYPTTTLRFPGYVTAARIGESGWVVHTGALASQRNLDFVVDIVDLGPGERLLTDDGHHDQEERKLDRRTFAYFGPASMVASDGITVIRSNSNEVQQLYDRFERQLIFAYGRLVERLGRPASQAPTVSLSYAPEQERRGIKGSVDGQFIGLNVVGYGADAFTDIVDRDLLVLTAHEVFHLWNGREGHRGRSRTVGWISEGGAEYVGALLGLPDAALGEGLTLRINECLIAVGTRSLNQSQSARQGRVPYSCGTLAMMFVDAGVRQADAGDVLTVWNSVFAETSAEDADLEANFLRAVAEHGGHQTLAQLSEVLDGWSAADTHAFKAFLEGAGLQLRQYQPGATERQDLNLSLNVLRAVLGHACPSGLRIEFRAERFMVHESSTCEPGLAASFDIASLNGTSITDQPMAAFEAVRRHCQTEDTFTVEGVGPNEALSFACGPGLRQHPGLFQIDSLGQLADRF